MKKLIRPLLFIFLAIGTTVLVSSCEEETVLPANGNIVGTDDWEKHNV